MSPDPTDLTPAQSESVRRALAAARHDGPVPDEVVSRLDARLMELHAERTAGGGATYAAVVPAADRFRRRNRWTTALVAAAAVTAVGLGSTQLLGRGSDDRTPSSADAARESSVAGASSAPPMAADTLGLSVALTPEQQATLASAGYTNLAQEMANLKRLDANAYNDLDSAPAHDNASTMAKAMQPCDGVPRDQLPPGAPTYTAERGGQLYLLAITTDVEGPVAKAWPCAGGTPVTIRLD